ncbi:hypothetical protein [Nonomuraea candida]|uniref:hypothetical protein n=1 Tax=Nonomuraea candida TaxID=359159 RepID=UPI0005B8C0AA|nr:hypothetical protein [Nonomuraea candida]
MVRAIIDITRANPGTERKLVEAVLAQDGGRFSARPLVTGFNNQESRLSGIAAMVQFASLGDWLPEAEINEQTARLAATPASEAGRSGDTVLIYSFHHSILNLEGAVGSVSPRPLTTPLRAYARNTAIILTEWPDELMPLDQAVASLAATLAREGATVERPVAKTNVRPQLVRQDPRFDKRAHPSAALPGLITLLLEKARDRGLIQTVGVDPGTQVYLTAAGQAYAAAAHAVPHLPATAGSGSGSGAASGAEVAASDPVGITAGGSSGGGQDRSALFQTILRQTDFGIFPQVRQDFYAHMKQIAAELGDGPPTSRELCRQAARRTKEGAPDKIKQSRRDESKGEIPKDAYPWKKLEQFGMRALARAGLLAGPDGRSIGDGDPWRIPSARVASLPDDLADLLDGEMVVEIIRKCPDVGWQDCESLAGAVLDGRSDDDSDRIAGIVVMLIEQGRIEWDATTQVLRIGPVVPTAPVVPAVPVKEWTGRGPGL